MKTVHGVLLFLLLLLAGCSGIQVSQDYDTEMGIPELRSYAWKAEPRPRSEDYRVNSPLLHKRFRAAIDQQLQSLGYLPTTAPDFLVDYSYSIDTRLESDPANVGFGFGVGRYYRYGGVGFNTGTDIRQYDVGTLVIDFLDPASGELLWRGRGSEIVSRHPSPQESAELASRLAEAILSQFPPR